MLRVILNIVLFDIPLNVCVTWISSHSENLKRYSYGYGTFAYKMCIASAAASHLFEVEHFEKIQHAIQISSITVFVLKIQYWWYNFDLLNIYGATIVHW